MGIAAGSAHLMAADAELLARAAVTRFASGGVAPCCRTVRIAGARGANPTGRMGIAGDCADSVRLCLELIAIVAGGARLRRVTARAQAGAVGALLRVAGEEAGAMEAAALRPVEREPRRRERHHAGRMARDAEALGVTGLTHAVGARGGRGVLAREIGSVNQVIFRCRLLFPEIHVAAAAVLGRKLLLVTVAAQALRHFRAQHGGAGGGVGMAAHAVGLGRFDVRPVVEAQHLTRALGASAGVGQAVAAVARAGIVGLLVTTEARRRARPARLVVVVRHAHVGVAIEAMHARHSVRMMLERMLRVLGPNAENGRARAGRTDSDHEEHARPPHRVPHRPESLSTPPTLTSYCGVELVSKAAAASRNVSG